MDVVVIGEGTKDNRRTLERRADDRFRFLSNLPFEELQAAYHAADAFTLLSRTEGLPTVALEAMNAQLPIITTPAGALVDVVTDGENGWVLGREPSGEALARAIRHYIENPEEARAIGARNRVYVRAVFDWERIAERIEAVYEEVLDARKETHRNRTHPE
jgi:glycosyltransferase involved in cell wall biosynthesis